MATAEHEILTGAKAALIAAGTSAGSRVFVARSYPLSQDELPAIALSVRSSRSEFLIRPATRLKTSIDLTMLCFAAATLSGASAEESAESAAHTLEQAATTALLHNPRSWDSGIGTIESRSSEPIDPSQAEYVFAGRRVVLTFTKVATFEESAELTPIESIAHDYTYGTGEGAETVQAVTELEE